MNTISFVASHQSEDDKALATLEEIYYRHVSTVYKICFMMLKNVEDAEDGVQTIFLKLMKETPTFNSLEHEKAWLIVVAKNHCKNMQKQHWFKKRVDLEKIQEPCCPNESWKRELLEEVLNLKDKYRLVIYLYYYEGYSTEEIGKILHLNSATVRTRLHTGRKLLKMNLEDVK